MYANWSWEEQEIDCTEANLWLRLPPWALVRALVGFHSFTGWYTVRRFSSKGKITCWKSLKKADKTTVQGFIDLGQTDIPSEVANSVRGNVIFVNCIYLGQATKITVVSGGCCSRKIKQSVKSSHPPPPPPPPKLKLHEHILCANYQARIWHLAHIANPILAPWMDKRGGLSLSCKNITKTSPRCCD